MNARRSAASAWLPLETGYRGQEFCRSHVYHGRPASAGAAVDGGRRSLTCTRRLRVRGPGARYRSQLANWMCPAWLNPPSRSFMADLFDNLIGLMASRIRRVRLACAGVAGAAVREDGLQAGRPPPQQGCAAVPSRRHQLHRQPRAEVAWPVFFGGARTRGPAHSPSAYATRTRPMHARSNWARSRRGADRPDGTAPARNQGHRRCALYLIDRSKTEEYLRHRLRVATRRRAPPEGARLQDRRSPDTQRLSRPHGVLGELLREDLQLPRDPLLRHQGRVYGPDDPALTAPDGRSASR